MRVYKGNYCYFLFSWIFECTDKIVTGVHLVRIKITLTKMVNFQLVTLGIIRLFKCRRGVSGRISDCHSEGLAGSSPVFCTNIAGCLKLVSGESHKLVRKPRRFESSSRNTIEVDRRYLTFFTPPFFLPSRGDYQLTFY